MTSRCSQAETRSWTVSAAPATTVDCGEATTATTTSLMPRAVSSESTCWAGSSTDAVAPRACDLDISRERRQTTRAPSSSESAPATTAAAASPSECPITRRGLHAVCPQGGGHGDLHGEQRRLHPVLTGDRLLRRHRLGHRETRLLGDDRLGLRDGCGEHRLGRQEVARPSPAHCEPWPENTHTGPRSSRPTAGS